MSQSKEQAREDPHSLAPIAIAAANDEQEIAKMRRGSGLRMGVALLLAAVAVAGGAQLLRTMDTRQAYASAASQLDRSDVEQREAFMRCALPTYSRSQVTNAGALRSAVESASVRMEKNYGKLLAKCTPVFAAFQSSITEIKAPADVNHELNAVSKAVGELGAAFTRYREHLQGTGQSYDAAQAAPLIDAIGTSWQDYLKARERAKQALSAKL